MSLKGTLSRKEETTPSNSSRDKGASSCLSLGDRTPLIILRTRDKFPPRSTSNEESESRPFEDARETLRGTPLSSFTGGGGGSPKEGLAEPKGGVLKGLGRDFLEEPLKIVLEEAEAGLFPLESLEEGVPLGERGGGVPPPQFPDWFRKSLPNIMFAATKTQKQ
ncbi:UNVERIFIED_CONTAM: hypothetical protein Sradi_0178600 [Sesamum radiatum]|uniref:Uncharacterized protein n=1 Tax=Sesamum radiatum TaxID=300843 RepID=A0AAW2VZ71_SESRA